MTELKLLNETVDFMGFKLPVIEGGFGEGQRIVTELQIAKVHSMEVREVRKSIKRLVDNLRLKLNIDYIDIKSKVKCLPVDLLLSFGYAKTGITQANSIFLLSLTGYKIFLNSLLFDSVQGKDILKYYFKDETFVVIKDYTRMEIEFFEMLSDSLIPFDITINKQYKICGYRLDGYIQQLNIAIEYDEGYHQFQKEEDLHRENTIIYELGCKFIRLSHLDSHAKNIGIVIYNILNSYKI